MGCLKTFFPFIQKTWNLFLKSFGKPEGLDNWEFHIPAPIFRGGKLNSYIRQNLCWYKIEYGYLYAQVLVKYLRW